MATSIFFTESKDFKLIKDRILSLEDNYLVYVYADTTNVRIPRELIMQLPRYGNSLIWVDTADMDSADLSHHIVLTIGQLVNPEEEIDFYIVSKSSKLEKTIIFLRNQGIPAEMIAPAQEKQQLQKTKGTGKRGRPKKAKIEEKPVKKTGKRGRPKKEKPAIEAIEAPVKKGKRGRPRKIQPEAIPVTPTGETPKKKRGRPSLAKTPVEVIPAEPKKRGRKKVEKSAAEVKTKRGRKPAVKQKKITEKATVKEAKKVKEPKKAKPRKQRVDKEITEEMVQDKLRQFATSDPNVSMVMHRLFSLKKVARPKFEAKLVEMIKDITLEDDTVAERIVAQLQKVLAIGATGPGGRIFYKD